MSNYKFAERGDSGWWDIFDPEGTNVVDGPHAAIFPAMLSYQGLYAKYGRAHANDMMAGFVLGLGLGVSYSSTYDIKTEATRRDDGQYEVLITDRKTGEFVAKITPEDSLNNADKAFGQGLMIKAGLMDRAGKPN